MLAPESCTTCGGDSVKEHGVPGGGGGSAFAPAAAATPLSATVVATQRTASPENTTREHEVIRAGNLDT
jgi:hypothetical protein